MDNLTFKILADDRNFKRYLLMIAVNRLLERLNEKTCYEAGAILKAQKEKGLYGEHGEDFIVSSRVKTDDLDWAEPFFETLDGKGWLVFIREIE